MRNPIRTKTKNQIRRYMYAKPRESATTVVHMGTRVDILWREKKTSNKISTVCTEKRKECYSRNNYGQEFKYFHRKGHKKRSSGRNKEMKKKRKRERKKSLISLKRYIMTGSSLAMMH